MKIEEAGRCERGTVRGSHKGSARRTTVARKGAFADVTALSARIRERERMEELDAIIEHLNFLRNFGIRI